MQITSEQFESTFSALGLRPESVSPILDRVEAADLKGGDHLIEHGGSSDTLYFLLSGRLALNVDAGNRTLSLGEVAPGRWVGEFGFIDPGQASASVTAVEPSSVLALSHDAMRDLHQSSPDAASDLLQCLSLDLARRLRETSRQVLVKGDDTHFELRSETLEERHPRTGLAYRIRKLLGVNGDEG